MKGGAAALSRHTHVRIGVATPEIVNLPFELKRLGQKLPNLAARRIKRLQAFANPLSKWCGRTRRRLFGRLPRASAILSYNLANLWTACRTNASLEVRGGANSSLA
jgi:hypothetical protein